MIGNEMSEAGNFRLRLEPIETDRFEIVVLSQTGIVKSRLRGPANLGYTEDDLRHSDGLPKLGLSESRIVQEIASANARRLVSCPQLVGQHRELDDSSTVETFVCGTAPRETDELH